jgi:hypothetical protein
VSVLSIPTFDSEMKLYVVGEDTADPDQWSQWSEYALVIAEDEQKAIELSGRHGPATEIPMDRPLYLVGMTEPNHGDDI